MAFDFKRHLIKVQGGRSYLPVSARLIWFRSEHPDWGIETEAVEMNHEKQYAVFRARIYNEDGKLMAMGTKKEDVKGFGDFIEKAETGSVGRALAMCGYGTQFSPELDETGSGRFADSPQPMGGNRFGGNSGGGYQGGGNGGNSGGQGGGSRFGSGESSSDGGTRFTPPRDFRAPPREDAPARPSPSREDAPARPSAAPAARRPAPAPNAEDDDEFEALIGGAQPLAVTEDDPFGEDEGPAPAAAPKANAASSPVGMPACNNCGKALTKAQQELSVRNFGEALCPGCQRERPRTDRPAAAAR